MTVNNEAAAAAVPRIVEELDRLGVAGADHRRLPLQRPPAPHPVSRLRPGPGEVPDQSRERRRQAARRELPRDHGRRAGQRQAGADRGQLGLARPEPADRADGRERAPAVTPGRARRDHGGDGGERAPLRRARRVRRACGTTGSSSAPRCPACRTWWTCIACSPHAATIRSTWASPRPASAAKGIIASTAGLEHPAAGGDRRHHPRLAHPAPGGDRTEEVQVAQQVLQSLGLRSFTPQVTSCPGCGRTTSTFFQEMAQEIQDYLREKMPVWRQERPGVEEMKVAVMGCVVNGPGESKHAEHRDLAARHVRGAEGAGVRGRPAAGDAQGGRASWPSSSRSSKSTWPRATGRRPRDGPRRELLRPVLPRDHAAPRASGGAAGAVRRRPRHQPDAVRLSDDPDHGRDPRWCRGDRDHPAAHGDPDRRLRAADWPWCTPCWVCWRGSPARSSGP